MVPAIPEEAAELVGRIGTPDDETAPGVEIAARRAGGRHEGSRSGREINRCGVQGLKIRSNAVPPVRTNAF